MDHVSTEREERKVGNKENNCIKQKPLLQLRQDAISKGLLDQPENMEFFSRTTLSTIPRGFVVFLFALPSVQQLNNLWTNVHDNYTQVAASRMKKLWIFVYYSSPLNQELIVTILQMGKLRHVMVQAFSIRSLIFIHKEP